MFIKEYMTDVKQTLENVGRGRMTHEEFKKHVDNITKKKLEQKKVLKVPLKKTQQEILIKNLRKGDHIIFKKNKVEECGLIINKYEAEFDIKQCLGNFVVTGLIKFDKVVRKAYASDIEKIVQTQNTDTNISLFGGNI